MENSPTVSFHTLGCRLNFAESGSIADGFKQRGYSIVPFGDSADVTFINTCTVTDGADSTCRNIIRKAHRASPEGKIVVAGCYAQMEAPKIEKMMGVDLVLGTSQKYKVFEYLDQETEDATQIDKSTEFWGAATTLADARTRAFLKIQDGCNYVCSFCIIPQARGRSRTIEISEAVDQAQNLVDNGYKEIVLTGVNIGEYESISGQKLEDLVAQVLEIEGLKRLRLGSVEPNTLTEELLQILKSSPKSMNHFHIPLQSGCDQILKSMRRKYDVAQYREVISMIQSYFPNCAFGADVICGYPGETDKQFTETKSLLEDLPITHFHVFPYSKRKNTTAAKMDNHIQAPLKKARVNDLIALGEKKLTQFAFEKIGEVRDVLFEKTHSSGYYEGHLSEFIKVRLNHDASESLQNQLKQVRLESYDPYQKTFIGSMI